ncbi:hypothetical protein ASG66_00200 [Bacillus sp. Leaf406]|nr:hypothetical protein ASG66_00200 [Bacillus sp. Leaf406]
MDRSFSLQALAFRGEEIEPPRACGVSLLLLFRWSQAPSASMHSLVLNTGMEGGGIASYQASRIEEMVLPFPILYE